MGQKTLTLENFETLSSGDLNSLEIRDPRLAMPGDVLGVGFLPKDDHLLGRTPNLRFVQEELEEAKPFIQRREFVERPIVNAVLPAPQYVDQPMFNNFSVNVQAPDVTLPTFSLKDKDCIPLQEPAPLNLPQMTMPGEINAALPQVNVARLNAEMPQVSLNEQIVEMPEVNVQGIDTELPEVNVRGIELAAFPDVNVPELNASLPDIALPQAQAVIMPKVAVPALDDEMPQVNLPRQTHMNLPDLAVPDLGTELPNLKVQNAYHDQLPEINLPGITANIPDNRIEDTINVRVPDINIPQLLLSQAPEKVQADIREIMPDVLTRAGFYGAADITTREKAAVVIPQMAGINVQAPNIADMFMKSRTAIAPAINIPQLSVRAPSVKARGTLAGNFALRPQHISFPKVSVQAPRVDFSNVDISKIPHICVQKDVGCPKWVVPVPPINGSYQMVKRVVVPAPLPKKVIAYVMLPRDYAQQNNLAFREVNDKVKVFKAKRPTRVVTQKVLAPANKGLYLRSELPNEVAGAYGIKRDATLNKLQDDLMPKYIVGQSLG